MTALEITSAAVIFLAIAGAATVMPRWKPPEIAKMEEPAEPAPPPKPAPPPAPEAKSDDGEMPLNKVLIEQESSIDKIEQKLKAVQRRLDRIEAKSKTP